VSNNSFVVEALDRMEQGFGKMEQRSCRRMQQELDKMVLGTQALDKMVLGSWALDKMELDKREQQEQRSCRRTRQELDKMELGKMELGTQVLDKQELRSTLWVC